MSQVYRLRTDKGVQVSLSKAIKIGVRLCTVLSRGALVAP